MPQQPIHNRSETRFIELQSVDSTNNYALHRIHEGLSQSGEVIFAHEQLSGKGQRGKSWQAEKGANILMSIVANPQPLPVSAQFHLSACAAVAAHIFFSKYAGESTKIKWPNDIYWQDRKAGGILIESVVAQQASVKKDSSKSTGILANTWKMAVVGFGININQTKFEASLKNPVSLKQISGKNFDCLQLSQELAAIFNTQLAILQQGGFEKIYDYYTAALYKKGMPVKLKKESRSFEAVVIAVTKTGKLIVNCGIEEEFDFGEVEWLLAES